VKFALIYTILIWCH